MVVPPAAPPVPVEADGELPAAELPAAAAGVGDGGGANDDKATLVWPWPWPWPWQPTPRKCAEPADAWMEVGVLTPSDDVIEPLS